MNKENITAAQKKEMRTEWLQEKLDIYQDSGQQRRSQHIRLSVCFSVTLEDSMNSGYDCTIPMRAEPWRPGI